MRLVCLAALFMIASTAGAGDPAPQVFNFDKAKVGELPAGWKAGVTGKADGSVWKVVEDKSNPIGAPLVLAQTSTNANAIFNLCILDEGKYRDVDIAVAFKAVAGEKDQGGGILWRAKDNDNYYLVRMNPLEDNFRFYTVVAGKRKELASKDVKAETGKWHTLRVIHKGNKIQCYLNGKLLIEATDETFPQAGKIGLWTKADAQTYFGPVTISAKKE